MRHIEVIANQTDDWKESSKPRTKGAKGREKEKIGWNPNISIFI